MFRVTVDKRVLIVTVFKYSECKQKFNSLSTELSDVNEYEKKNILVSFLFYFMRHIH